jgi:hypothetical protein
MAKILLRVQYTYILERVLFGRLFTALPLTFAPMATFGLTVLACLVLSQM